MRGGTGGDKILVGLEFDGPSESLASLSLPFLSGIAVVFEGS